MSGGPLWPGGPVELPASVRLGDESYRVRRLDRWSVLHALAEQQWTRLVPSGLVRADRYRVAVRLYDPGDALDYRHLWQAGTRLGGALAGTLPGEGHDPGAGWWPATRIAGNLTAHWLSFDGWCVRRGFDPHAAPVHRLIAAGWQFMLDHRPTEGAGKDEKQISPAAFREKVWTPPGPYRSQIMRFTAAQERQAALAALRESLPR